MSLIDYPPFDSIYEKSRLVLREILTLGTQSVWIGGMIRQVISFYQGIRCCFDFQVIFIFGETRCRHLVGIAL